MTQEALPISPSRAQVETSAAKCSWMPRQLVIVLVFGLVLRLGLAAWLHGMSPYVADEQDYDAIATNLAQHFEFAIQPGTPTSIRPPAYPTLVAVIYSLANERNYTAVRVVQSFLGVLIAWVVFLLARGMYDERTGFVAAAICAFYPSLVAATGLVLTETLFTLLVCSSCLLLAQYFQRGGVWWLAAFGATLALGALTRSVLWLFPPVMVLFFLVCDCDRPLSRRFVHAAAAVFAFVLVIAPWAVRSTRLQQTFTAVDVMGGRNFMMGNYEHTPLSRPWDAISMSGEKAWHAMLFARFPNHPPLTQGQLDKLALRYGLEYVRQHPGQTLVRAVAKFFHFWQLEREVIAGLRRGWWGQIPTVGVLIAAAMIVGAYVLTLTSGIFGAIVRPSAQWQMQTMLVLMIAFICGIHTLVFGHSRYHLPLMPLVAIFAAAAWTRPQAILSQWRRPWFWLAASMCAVLAVSWYAELVIESGRF